MYPRPPTSRNVIPNTTEAARGAPDHWRGGTWRQVEASEGRDPTIGGEGDAVNGYLLQIEELAGLIDTLSHGAQRVTEANRALRDAEPTDLGSISIDGAGAVSRIAGSTALARSPRHPS